MIDLKVRVSVEMREWLAATAKANCRSVNGEIVHCLKRAKEGDSLGTTGLPKPIRSS